MVRCIWLPGMVSEKHPRQQCAADACSKWNEKTDVLSVGPTCALRRSDLPVFELYMDAVPFCKSVTGR